MNLDHLIAAYLSGQATSEEVAELEAAILVDESVRRTFLRHARADAILAATATPALMPIAETTHVPRRLKFLSPAVLAVAAVFVLLTVSIVTMMRDVPGVKVEVLAATGRAADEFALGSSVRLEQLRLFQGVLQLKLESGVTLDLAGPIEADFVAPLHIVLRTGSLTADVGVFGKGFVVETSNTKIIDLGTRFRVSTHETGETDVIVVNGEVEVYRAENEQAEIPIDPNILATLTSEMRFVSIQNGLRVGSLRLPCLESRLRFLMGKHRANR